MTSNIPEKTCELLEKVDDRTLKELSILLSELSRLQGRGDFSRSLKKVNEYLIDGEYGEISLFLQDEILAEDERIAENGGIGSEIGMNVSYGEYFYFEEKFANGKVQFLHEKKQRLDSLFTQARECWDKRNPDGYRDNIIAMMVLCRFKYY